MITQFPTFTFNKGHLEQTPLAGTSEEDQQCCICIMEYEDEEQVRVLPCKHCFHAPCIDQWLQLNRVCPLCKRDVNIMLAQRQSALEAGEEDGLTAPGGAVPANHAASPGIGVDGPGMAAGAGAGAAFVRVNPVPLMQDDDEEHGSHRSGGGGSGSGAGSGFCDANDAASSSMRTPLSSPGSPREAALHLCARSAELNHRCI